MSSETGGAKWASGRFPSTAWSVIQRAAGDSPEALAKLCGAYWKPVYAFVRGRGHSVEDAQDLTQEFFARVLEKHYFQDANRERGKFRSFLLAAVKHFLANEWDRARALKRGGDIRLMALDARPGKDGSPLDPPGGATPEEVFEKQWAITLLDRAMSRLEEEYSRKGQTGPFQQLKPFLAPGTEPRGSYQQIATRLNLSEGALKVAVHRLRRYYGDLVREEIADTVEQPAEIDEEIRYLLSILAKR